MSFNKGLMVSAGLALSLSVLAGCAEDPDDISASYVSVSTYKNQNCQQLMVENNRLCTKLNKMHGSLRTKARKDIAKATAGAVLTPFIFLTMDGKNSPESKEFARLKGSYEAVQVKAKSMHCKMARFKTPQSILAASKKPIPAKKETIS
ncbi:MAG TPA: hypothetical protein QF353_05850 [Gammaproteobacteria bacterium]|nr:hypothetical protein [Gammaproteobacteria bacterium]